MGRPRIRAEERVQPCERRSGNMRSPLRSAALSRSALCPGSDTFTREWTGPTRTQFCVPAHDYDVNAHRFYCVKDDDELGGRRSRQRSAKHLSAHQTSVLARAVVEWPGSGRYRHERSSPSTSSCLMNLNQMTHALAATSANTTAPVAKSAHNSICVSAPSVDRAP
jgi:hypothetical protein